MPKAFVNGIHLHYQQIGRGPSLVMVHGMTGNQAIWHLETIPALMGDYQITTYDLRGHGYSDMPATHYTTADHAQDLLGLLDGLGIERTHLAGHSFGAEVCLHFAILYPERVDRLVLVEPAVAALQHLRNREDWVGWQYWRDRLSAGGISVPPDKWYDSEYLVRASIRIPKLFGFGKGRARRAAPLIKLMETTTAAVDYSELAGMTLDKIAQLPHPTLLVYGAESVFLGTYEYLKDRLLDCTPILIPDSEHFGPLEQPARLIKHLQDFLMAERVQAAQRQALRADSGASVLRP